MDDLVLLDKTLKLGRYVVITDLHIGASIRGTRFGTQTKQKMLQHEINALLSLIPINLGDRLIILGDIKDWLGLPPKYAKKKILSFFNRLTNAFEEVIIIRGNHDGRLIEILDQSDAKNIRMTDHMVIKLRGQKMLLTHGHIKPETQDIKESSIIIMGHIHPTEPIKKPIILNTTETNHMKKLLIILPALNPKIIGKEPTLDDLFQALTRITPRNAKFFI